jgi:hypothetical protein
VSILCSSFDGQRGHDMDLTGVAHQSPTVGLDRRRQALIQSLTSIPEF